MTAFAAPDASFPASAFRERERAAHAAVAVDRAGDDQVAAAFQVAGERRAGADEGRARGNVVGKAAARGVRHEVISRISRCAIMPCRKLTILVSRSGRVEPGRVKP